MTINKATCPKAENSIINKDNNNNITTQLTALNYEWVLLDSIDTNSRLTALITGTLLTNNAVNGIAAQTNEMTPDVNSGVGLQGEQTTTSVPVSNSKECNNNNQLRKTTKPPTVSTLQKQTTPIKTTTHTEYAIERKVTTRANSRKQRCQPQKNKSRYVRESQQKREDINKNRRYQQTERHQPASTFLLTEDITEHSWTVTKISTKPWTPTVARRHDTFVGIDLPDIRCSAWHLSQRNPKNKTSQGKGSKLDNPVSWEVERESKSRSPKSGPTALLTKVTVEYLRHYAAVMTAKSPVGSIGIRYIQEHKSL